MDAGKAYDEVVDSLNRIEALITRDIIEYNTKLDKTYPSNFVIPSQEHHVGYGK